ncbi:MAG: hypothetical protein WED15_08850 [Akkermansiaceae bacterium]
MYSSTLSVLLSQNLPNNRALWQAKLPMLGALTLALLTPLTAWAQVVDNKPNVLFIAVDDLRPWSSSRV